MNLSHCHSTCWGTLEDQSLRRLLTIAQAVRGALAIADDNDAPGSRVKQRGCERWLVLTLAFTTPRRSPGAPTFPSTPGQDGEIPFGSHGVLSNVFADVTMRGTSASATPGTTSLTWSLSVQAGTSSVE